MNASKHPIILCTLLAICSTLTAGPTTMPTSALDHTVKDIDGNDYDLSKLKGKVVLIVNVASKCGFTKQYAGLEKLYETHKDKGLVVLGFPANNFGGQEPGSAEQIKEFCSTKFNVTFPLMEKISVKGEGIAPLYQFLTGKETAGKFAGDIKWNFNKFLIGRDGAIANRYDSKVTPEDPALVKEVETALQAK